MRGQKWPMTMARIIPPPHRPPPLQKSCSRRPNLCPRSQSQRLLYRHVEHIKHALRHRRGALSHPPEVLRRNGPVPFLAGATNTSRTVYKHCHGSFYARLFFQTGVDDEMPTNLRKKERKKKLFLKKKAGREDLRGGGVYSSQRMP